MPRAELIVRRLRAVGEAGEAAERADRLEAVAAAGEQLVDVALVGDVPDDLVRRAVEDAVEGERQLDDAEVRGEVASRLGGGGDQFLADLLG